ncbi:MAG: hypothetical protein RL153_2212, partial [Verrucomicrobiota bacterium]
MIRTPHANAMCTPTPAMMRAPASRDRFADPFGVALMPTKTSPKGFAIALGVVLAAALAPSIAIAQGTAFTYQGRLADQSRPANGSYDLQFSLFPQASGGTRIGAVLAFPGTPVTNGLFNLSLDFGQGAFNGSDR